LSWGRDKASCLCRSNHSAPQGDAAWTTTTLEITILSGSIAAIGRALAGAAVGHSSALQTACCGRLRETRHRELGGIHTPIQESTYVVSEMQEITDPVDQDDSTFVANMKWPIAPIAYLGRENAPRDKEELIEEHEGARRMARRESQRRSLTRRAWLPGRCDT
jgi:hypothetical protein